MSDWKYFDEDALVLASPVTTHGFLSSLVLSTILKPVKSPFA